MSADRNLLELIASEIRPDATEIRHLGTGGFACTFRVSDGSDVCALKIIDPSVAELERVDRELAAIQRVDNSHVVKFRNSGTHTSAGVNYLWIEMDYIEGHSLGSALSGGQVFTPLEAAQVIRQLVEGASAIWGQKTAHRDLSPNNIILRPNGDAVIVDMGMARHVDDDTITILPTPGTPGWMSPEQVSSSPTHGDWRSDQFVLGAIGYRILTGVRPFDGANAMERWVAPATHDPRPIRSIEPSVPSAMAEVVERMMSKQPFRRYLKATDLLADIDRAIAALQFNTVVDDRPQRFGVHIGQLKSWAEDGFLSDLSPGGVIIDIRAGNRVAEFVDSARAAGAGAVLDPATYFVRSPQAVQPDAFKALPYGDQPVLTGFSDEPARRAWCKSVLDEQMTFAPETVISPYFYAGEGEQSWISESLACARVYGELMDEETDPDARASIWTTVAVHSAWLSNSAARETLLNALTGQSMQALYILVHTPQPSFGPLADLDVLRGMRELLEVLREAGIPVIVGKRASSGLLLLALGADVWSCGVSSNQMNMAPHPETKERGGPAADRMFVPTLLNLITVSTYALMAQSANAHLVSIDTAPGLELLLQNPTLENLTSGQRVLLLRHNLLAQKSKVDELAARPSGQRVALVRRWVEEAQAAYTALPPVRSAGESSGFLRVWAEALI